jgi:hypothetical protein
MERRDGSLWTHCITPSASRFSSPYSEDSKATVTFKAASPDDRRFGYGMLILLALLFLLPVLEADLGFHTDLFSQVVTKPSEAIIHWITRLEGIR